MANDKDLTKEDLKELEDVFKGDFLPDGYEVPASKSKYMKFEQGDNKLRVMGSPIIGWEGWVTNNEGNRKPVRKKMDEGFNINEIDDPETAKHFWAMPVWNYSQKMIQILEITQKGIQRTLKSLALCSDWGSPINYDITITRTGEGMDTEYEVVPSPPKPVDADVLKEYKDTYINLEVLFEGGDPFLEPEN